MINNWKKFNEASGNITDNQLFNKIVSDVDFNDSIVEQLFYAFLEEFDFTEDPGWKQEGLIYTKTYKRYPIEIDDIEDSGYFNKIKEQLEIIKNKGAAIIGDNGVCTYSYFENKLTVLFYTEIAKIVYIEQSKPSYYLSIPKEIRSELTQYLVETGTSERRANELIAIINKLDK